MRMSRLRTLTAIVAIPLTIGGIYALAVGLEMAGSPTWTIGYYGKFNRVWKVIEKMPDIRIADSWQHHDITLEDFGFTVVADSGAVSQVDFLEGSSQMKLRRAE